jgi:hypothetical protein
MRPATPCYDIATARDSKTGRAFLSDQADDHAPGELARGRRRAARMTTR